VRRNLAEASKRFSPPKTLGCRSPIGPPIATNVFDGSGNFAFSDDGTLPSAVRCHRDSVTAADFALSLTDVCLGLFGLRQSHT
jgi:hypothetical protein